MEKIESEIERTRNRLAFMVLSDRDREAAEEYLFELYAERDALRASIDKKVRYMNHVLATLGAEPLT